MKLKDIKMRIGIFLLVLIGATQSMMGQRLVLPGQELLTPQLNNASYVGENQRTQITGIGQFTGAEYSSSSQWISAQMPIYENVSFGLDYFNDGLEYLKYSNILFTTVFKIGVGEEDHVNIGIAPGIESFRQDMVPASQQSPQFIPTINENNIDFTYRVGAHYAGEHLAVGGHYNRLPMHEITPVANDSDILAYELLDGYTLFMGYTIDVARNLSATPTVRYLSYLEEPIYEGSVKFQFASKVEAVVAYKNDYSINPAFRVLFFNALSAGYSYEKAMGSMDFEDIHSFGLSYRFNKGDEEQPEWMETAKENIEKTESIKEEKKKPVVAIVEEKPAVVVEEKKVVTSPTVEEKEALEKELKTVYPLSKGYYIVVATFADSDAADPLISQLNKGLYFARKGQKPGDDTIYVYIDKDQSAEGAGKRLKAHKLDKNFRNATLLKIE